MSVKIIWVATTGDDLLGDGSQYIPYKTIERALLDFESGDQIRILDGIYTPVDSIIISGMDGSIFAENPSAVTIQPQKTTVNSACISIKDTNRFTITGINIIQAIDSKGNLIGLSVENVENFIAYTCSIHDFYFPEGFGYGINAIGHGRLENCSVYNITSAGILVTGIYTSGIYPIDCSVVHISGVPTCDVYGYHHS